MPPDHYDRQWNSNGDTSETQGFSTVFEGGPCGIQWGSHDPLGTDERLAQGSTVKLFIFTRFLNFSAIDVIDVVLMLAPLLGGHAETQGFPTVFGSPQEAACWHVCSAWFLTYLAGGLIAHRLICQMGRHAMEGFANGIILQWAR